MGSTENAPTPAKKAKKDSGNTSKTKQEKKKAAPARDSDDDYNNSQDPDEPKEDVIDDGSMTRDEIEEREKQYWENYDFGEGVKDDFAPVIDVESSQEAEFWT